MSDTNTSGRGSSIQPCHALSQREERICKRNPNVKFWYYYSGRFQIHLFPTSFIQKNQSHKYREKALEEPLRLSNEAKRVDFVFGDWRLWVKKFFFFPYSLQFGVTIDPARQMLLASCSGRLINSSGYLLI